MRGNKIDNFNDRAKDLFKILVDNYGYVLDEVKINELNGMKWSIHLVYTNRKSNLKIVIKQEPCYTDYGFSFFIHNMETKEYNILYNVPHEEQDEEDSFLLKAYDDLFSTEETFDLITGKIWKKLNRIPFK